MGRFGWGWGMERRVSHGLGKGEWLSESVVIRGWTRITIPLGVNAFGAVRGRTCGGRRRSSGR